MPRKSDWSLPGRLEFMLSNIKIEEDCWIWTGFVDPDRGYGQIRLKSGLLKVHRFMAYCAFGFNLSQDEIRVLHKCHRRECINPSHLKMGTQSENLRDAAKAGRWHSGGGRNTNFVNNLKAKDWGKYRKTMEVE